MRSGAGVPGTAVLRDRVVEGLGGGEEQGLPGIGVDGQEVQQAAMSRADVPEAERRDFYLYVDEFQNFATPDFGDIASEGRKYHLPQIVSHQNIAQIEDNDLLKGVVGMPIRLFV